MGYPYLALTSKQRQEMLAAIGADSIADLFSDIPREILLYEDLDLPEPLTESERITQ